MENKKIITVLLVFIITLSCSKKNTENNESNPKSNSLIEVNVKLNFINNKNQDLLDSLTPNYYSKEAIKVYFLNGNKKELVTDADGNTEAATYLHNKEIPKVLELSTSYHIDTIIEEKDDFKIGRSTTYLELNESTVDTIVSEWKSGNNYFSVNKIWYNSNYHQLNGKPYKVVKNIN